MGHRHEAVEALRAYARDLETTIGDGVPLRVGSADQDDAAASVSGPGAPHLGLLTAAAGVVLVGSVGILSAFIGSGSPSEAVGGAMPEAAPGSTVAVTTDASTSFYAARASMRFTTLGFADAAAAVSAAVTDGTIDRSDVRAAIDRVLHLTLDVGDLADLDPDARAEVDAAVALLVGITRPPGLDPDRMPPGQGGTPPGQDDTFVPPGQDDTFVPPGQDDTFVPPGQDDTFVPPGQDDTFVPPGQDDTFVPPGQGGTPPGRSEGGKGSSR
jgi:hypothetical protein